MERPKDNSFFDEADANFHAAIGRALGQEDPRRIYKALRRSGLSGETALNLTIKIYAGELGPRDPVEVGPLD